MAQQIATSTWYPQLAGLNLPRELTNGLGQVFALVYSLRDTVQRLSATAATLIEYGTHHDRLELQLEALPEASLFFETDRGNVLYEARYEARQPGEWSYISGIWFEILDHRPRDLTGPDTGFLFWATDTRQLYRWSGTEWIEM